MEQKETYWSRFASDFEKRNIKVIGVKDVNLILNKVANLTPMKNVLEIGCGDGMYTNLLLDKSESITATDYSEQMVDVCQKRFEASKNLKVEKADCFDLPYPANSFDSVFMANLIHIIPNPQEAVKEVKRVLKENGSFIALSYSLKEMKFFDKISLMYRYFGAYGKPPKGGSNLGLQDAVGIIQKEGFEITEAEVVGEKSKAFFIKAICL